MIVNYYFVTGCEYVIQDGRPAVIAPGEIDPEARFQYGFIQLDDGKWCHYLTQKEYDDVMQGYPDHDVTFTYENAFPLYTRNNTEIAPQESAEDKKIAGILSGLSLLFFIIGGFLIRQHNYDFIFFFIPAVILNRIVRVRYPDNRIGKAMTAFTGVLSGIASIMGHLFIIGLFIFIYWLSHLG